ncbi:CaiB/BaiF CoA transferase family protein [Rhodovulum sp. DZ06]|uniref:CaiB/BaiF CoA transferase family protein n=1 Tax=Rhodovulum sp. DZ06 TaxID=3425126 RepID=UPI003D358DA1
MFESTQGAMLDGLKVVDLTGVVFGPLATQILGDHGAEVIKIEGPGGDVLRHTVTPRNAPGMAGNFMALNRGKASVMLDLRQEEDREVLRGLLEEADVFIHNVRLQGMERLGFGPDAVRALNPGIIYVHCSGFGAGGPYAGLQAYDDIIQAASGAATLLPRVDGNPQPRFMPSLLADKVGGLSAVYATLAALIHRMRTGEGQFVEVPMFEAFSKFMLQEHLGGRYHDPPSGPAGYQRQLDPGRQPCPTADGYVVFLPNRMPQWRPIFAALGDADYLDRHGLETDQQIRAAQPEIYQHVRTLTPAQTSAHWEEVLRAAGAPCMAVRDLEDMTTDPHLEAVGFFARHEHATEGMVNDIREPVRYGAWTPAPPGDAPALDADGARIRARLAAKRGGEG